MQDQLVKENAATSSGDTLVPEGPRPGTPDQQQVSPATPPQPVDDEGAVGRSYVSNGLDQLGRFNQQLVSTAGGRLEESRVRSMSELRALGEASRIKFDDVKRRIEGSHIVPMIEADIAKTHEYTQRTSAEVAEVLKSLSAPPPQEEDTPLSSEETVASALSMAFGGDANSVLNTVRGIHKAKDERNFRNAMRSYQAEQILNDKKLDIALNDLSFYRNMEASDKQALRAAMMKKEDSLVQIDLQQGAQELALGLKGLEINSGIDAQKLSMQWQAGMEAFRAGLQDYLRQRQEDFTVKTGLVDTLLKWASESVDPEATGAIFGAIQQALPGYVIPMELRVVMDKIARANKAQQDVVNSLARSKAAGSMPDLSEYGIVPGDSGAPTGQIDKTMPAVGAFNPPGADIISGSKKPPMEALTTVLPPSEWGEYGVPRYRPSKSESSAGESAYVELRGLYDHYDELQRQKAASDPDFKESDLRETTDKINEAKTRLVSVGGPTWLSLRHSVQMSMVDNLKYMKDAGASPRDITLAREAYKREWKRYYAGKWDEKGDFERMMKDAGMFDPQTEKIFGVDADGNFDVRKFAEMVATIPRLQQIMQQIEQEHTKNQSLVAGALGMADEEGLDDYDRAFEAWRKPSKSLGIAPGSLKSAADSAVGSMSDRIENVQRQLGGQ